MSCDKCYTNCSLRDVCDREEKLPRTNWEHLFSSPEKTAHSLRSLIECHDWEDCDHCFLKDKQDGGCLAYYDEERLEWLQEE